MHTILSQKSSCNCSWISILKYWILQFLILPLKSFSELLGEDWRIRYERCLTALERDSSCKARAHILNLPKAVKKQRTRGNSRWPITKSRCSPGDSSLDTAGYSIQPWTVPRDIVLVCTLLHFSSLTTLEIPNVVHCYPEELVWNLAQKRTTVPHLGLKAVALLPLKVTPLTSVGDPTHRLQ